MNRYRTNVEHQTETTTGYLVSTVKLPDGMFETMVFGKYPNGQRSWNDVACYRTRDAAHAGILHRTAVARWNAVQS